MVARIKQLLDWQQLSPTQFADRIGVGRPVMSHILSERNKPSLEVARSIKAAFPEISFDWLLNGIGDMLVIPAPSASASASRPVGEVAPTAATPTAAAPVAASPVPTIEPVAPATPITVSPVGQAKPAYQQPQPSAPAPTRFMPAGRNTASKATPGSSELTAERFVVRGVGQAPSAAGQPLPDVTLPPPGTVPPTTAPPALAIAASVPAAPAPVESPSPAAVAALAATQPTSTAAAEAVAMAQALASGLSDSNKAIRRIVILYSDGSFADYKPES